MGGGNEKKLSNLSDRGIENIKKKKKRRIQCLFQKMDIQLIAFQVMLIT